MEKLDMVVIIGAQVVEEKKLFPEQSFEYSS